MRLMIITLVFSILCLIPHSRLDAQQAPPIVPGSRVRIFAPSIDPAEITGTVEQLTKNSLVLQTDDPAQLSVVPLASISQVDISRGRPSLLVDGLIGMGPGALLGVLVTAAIARADDQEYGSLALVGAPVGALDGFVIGAAGSGAFKGLLGGAAVGALAGAITISRDEFDDDTNGQVVFFMAGLSAQIGMIIGAAAWPSPRPEKWERIPLHDIRITVVPLAKDQVAVAVSLAF